MSEMNDVVKLAIDAYKGRVEKYSVGQSMDVLREALIEANGGDTKLDYKKIRDGKCVGLFTIIEEILKRTVVEGLQGDEFFNAMVDFRNLAEGDQNEFVIEDGVLFEVASMANGTQGIRRQRIGNPSVKKIETVRKGVRIYEELNRVLAGRVDFNSLIAKVAESVKQKLLKDIYALWISAASDSVIGGSTYFPAAGAYSESALLQLIEHVEAAAGGNKTATVIGTKAAVRNLAPSILSDMAKDDMYNQGYIGKFFGSPVIVTPQRHEIGSTQFVMDDKVLTVIAGDNKPLKVVYEGDPLIIPGEPNLNADLTQEYLYSDCYGTGIVAAYNAGLGRYTIA